MSEVSVAFENENSPKCWAICGKNEENNLMMSLQLDGDRVRQGVLKFNVNSFDFLLFSPKIKTSKKISQF